MDWLGNIGKGIGDFVSWLNPFDDDDKKKRKKDNQVVPEKPTPKPKPTPIFGQNNNQTNNTLNSFEPKQYQNNPLNLDFTANNSKIDDLTTQVNGQTVAKAPQVDKKTTDKIPGYYIMSPEAQNKAVANLPNSPEAKMDKLKKKIEDDKKKQENVKKFSETLGAIPGVNFGANAATWLTSLAGKATGNKDWEERASNTRNMINLGMTNEEIEAIDDKQEGKIRTAGNVISALSPLDLLGITSIAKAPIIAGGKQALKEGITSQAGKQILKESAKETGKQYGKHVAGGTAVAGAVDPALQAYIKDGQVDWSSVPSSMLQGGLWAAAIPEFSDKARLTQKLKRGEQLTSEDSAAINKALNEELSHVTKTENLPSILNDGKVNPSKLQDTEELPDFEKLDAAYLQKGTKPYYSHPDTSNVNIIYKRSSLGDIIDQGDEAAKMGGIPNEAIDRIQVPNQAVADVVTKAGYKAEIVPELDTTPKAGSVDKAVAEQKAQQAKQNSVKQGGMNYNDMMARLQQRRETGQPAQDTRAASVQKEAPVDYSDAALEQRLGATGLSQQEVNNLTTQYGMSKQEWQILLNRVGDLSTAKSKPAVIASELKKMRAEGIHGQTRAAMNNNVTAQRLAKEAEAATPTKETAGGTVVDTPAGKTNTETGEIIDDIPELTAANPLQEAIARATAIVEDLDESVRKMGFDPEDLRRKKQAANRGEYEMTELEQAASIIHTQRLNEARQVLADSGLEFDGSQIHYTPQVRQGEAGLPATREELTNFGYANQRKNAIPLEELDYSNLAEIDYIVKAENKDLVIADAIERAAEVDGRPVTPESVQIATKQTMDLQKKIADAKGSEKVINNDTVSDLNQIGRNEGYVQEMNTTKAGAISQEPREMLTRAKVYDRGFLQYDNSAGYAYEFTKQVIDNNIPPSQLAEALTQSIRKAMPNAEQSTVTEAVYGAIRRVQNRNLQGQDIMPQVMSAFRSVSKAELFRLGKTTDFADKKMKAVVNEQINARLLQDNYSKNFAQELDSFIAQRINASLRGMNIVSAAFEMGDVANILSNYGVKNLKDAKFGFGKVDGDSLGMSKRYGEASPHFLSTDLPKVNKLDEVWSDESTNILQKIKRSYETGENKLLIFRYVEQYKTELFFRQADDYWRSRGLQGTDLVNQVQKDYLDTMLPNKIITANRLLGKLPKSLTQYLNWSVQATKRLGRTIGGTNEAGMFRDMSRGSRIARGVSTELVPKVAAAAVLGVPIQQILGMRDWTGATDGDFSGIPEEEKNALDGIMSYVGMSPALGGVSNLYYAWRRNEIAGTDDDERTQQNPNWFGDALAAESTKLIPFYTQINKTLGVQDAVNQGYFENKDGRVQFDAPEAGSLNHLLGLITGKTYMRENRDYSDNPDLLSVLQGKASLGDLLTHNQTIDNLMQTLGFDTARDYQRPVADKEFTVGKDEAGDALEFNYNEWVKEGYAKSKEIGEQRLGDAKAYNEVYDKLRRENPEAFEAYNQIMDNNDLVSPEYWSALTGTNSEGDFDLTLVKMIGDRKKEVAKASGKPNSYDPMYDLPDDQLRSLLQLKSTATGDDLALRNILYKTEWYNKYVDDRDAYFDGMPEGVDDNGIKQTPRVKQWNAYNDQLTGLSLFNNTETAAAFPYHAAYKQAEAAFEEKNKGKDFYGSPERDAWMAQYKDGYYGEKEALDSAKLAIINQMRVIEGFPPMSADEYTQATEVANTSGSGGSGGSSKSGGSYEPLPNIYNDFTWQGISNALKPSKVRAFKPNTSVGRRTNSRKSMGARARGGDTYAV